MIYYDQQESANEAMACAQIEYDRLCFESALHDAVMTHRILNIALAIAVIALWMVAAAKFDQELLESDQRHYSDQQTEQRKRNAAIKICGNGNALWIDDTTLQCSARKGKSVVTAKL